MKKIYLIVALAFAGFCSGQTLVQSINSGSIIGTSSSVSVGEIVVVPVNPSQSSSGLIGILTQLNQTLEVSEFELTKDIVVYPNPTMAGIYFKSAISFHNEKVVVYNTNGQLVVEKTISADNSVDLSELATGIYTIQLATDTKKSFKIIKH